MSPSVTVFTIDDQPRWVQSGAQTAPMIENTCSAAFFHRPIDAMLALCTGYFNPCEVQA